MLGHIASCVGGGRRTYERQPGCSTSYAVPRPQRWSARGGRVTDSMYDLEAEQAVLGAFLIDDDTWPRIRETFCADAFYLVAHQAIARAVIARRAKGEPADPILLRGDLADAGDLTS